MNVFNRIIVVILLLFLVFVSAIGIINIYANLFSWAEIPSLFLSNQVRMNPYIGTAILAGIFIVSIILLIFEFRRRKKKRASISSGSLGRAMITTQTISRHIDSELLKFDEIKNIKSKAIVKKNGIFADIYAKISEGENLTKLTERVRNAVYDLLTENLGLNVAKIEFTITGLLPVKEEAGSYEENLIISQVKEALLKEEEDKQAEEEKPEEEIEEEEPEIEIGEEKTE